MRGCVSYLSREVCSACHSSRFGVGTQAGFTAPLSKSLPSEPSIQPGEQPQQEERAHQAAGPPKAQCYRWEQAGANSQVNTIRYRSASRSRGRPVSAGQRARAAPVSAEENGEGVLPQPRELKTMWRNWWHAQGQRKSTWAPNPSTCREEGSPAVRGSKKC